MKDRKKFDKAPLPFVKHVPPKRESQIRVSHMVRETLPANVTDKIPDVAPDVKKILLHNWNSRVFELQASLAEAIAIRDALNVEVNTLLAQPHWIRHASIQSLHGDGARIRPCEKLHNGVQCRKPTEWSFDGKPQCSFPTGVIPTSPEHAICLVETGFKKNVTREERDVANILSSYGTERKGSKK